MVSTNSITGDELKTKGITTDAYRDSWERIFGAGRKEEKTIHDEYHEMVYILNSQSDTPSTDDHGIPLGTEK